jgi:hypothetical protein
LARKVRTDHRWDAGVGAEGEPPGRALARCRPTLLRPSIPILGVELDINNEEDSRGERSGTVWRL